MISFVPKRLPIFLASSSRAAAANESLPDLIIPNLFVWPFGLIIICIHEFVTLLSKHKNNSTDPFSNSPKSRVAFGNFSTSKSRGILILVRCRSLIFPQRVIISVFALTAASSSIALCSSRKFFARDPSTKAKTCSATSAGSWCRAKKTFPPSVSLFRAVNMSISRRAVLVPTGSPVTDGCSVPVRIAVLITGFWSVGSVSNEYSIVVIPEFGVAICLLLKMERIVFPWAIACQFII